MTELRDYFILNRASVRDSRSRLHHLLVEIFGDKFGMSLTTAFIFCFGNAVVGVLNGVRAHQTKGRYPLTLPLLGKVFYMLAVLSLVGPKIYLAVVSLEKVPYFYPVTAALELVIIFG